MKCVSDQEKEYRGMSIKVIGSNGLLLATITNPAGLTSKQIKLIGYTTIGCCCHLNALDNERVAFSCTKLSHD